MKKLASIITVLALLTFATPTDADAQVTTTGTSDCIICNPNCTWPDEHTDFVHSDGPWWRNDHNMCFWGSCDDTHQSCSIGDANPVELERQERIKNILDTMEGDERIIALVEEFPTHIHLTTGGSALEVLGAACDDAKMIGRLNLTMSQAVAVLDAKASYLASN